MAPEKGKKLFSRWYAHQFANTLSTTLTEADGFPLAELKHLLGGKQIPLALHNYYLVAGRHWMNSNFERLLAPDHLRFEGEYVVFMDENQNVAHWGYKQTEASKDDPQVYCGSWEGDELVWYDEKRLLSQFIIDMWLETCTGGE